MSRTQRKVPPGKKWIEGFVEKLRRGHVRFPVRKKDTDGWLYEEIWNRKAKKWAKNQRNRKVRRNNREDHLDVQDS